MIEKVLVVFLQFLGVDSVVAFITIGLCYWCLLSFAMPPRGVVSIANELLLVGLRSGVIS